MKILSVNELSLVSGGLVQTQANSPSHQVLIGIPPIATNRYNFKFIVTCGWIGGLAGSIPALIFRGSTAFIPVGAVIVGNYATAKVLDRLAFGEEAV